MRVKVGNVWYRATPSQPIMVELNEKDKWNLDNMQTKAHNYAEFHDSTLLTKNEKLKWMQE